MTIPECVLLAMLAMVDYQLGRDLSEYPPDLVEAVEQYPVIEISLEQERLIDNFGELYCENYTIPNTTRRQPSGDI